jgi:hypothetical protein
MDDGNDFLVTLPSNSNMSSHPSNEPANYTVKLATPISLQGEWEAALVSVQYTNNWVITNDLIFLRFILHEWGDNAAGAYKQKGTSDFVILDDTTRMVSAAQLLSKHQTSRAGLEDLQVLYKDTYIYPHHYVNAQELGDEVCRAFHIAFPNTKVRLFYLYDHASCSGRFVVNNGEIAILSLDKRIGDLLGHLMGLVSCGVCDADGKKELLGEVAIRALLNINKRQVVDDRHWYLLDRLGNRTGLKKPKIRTISSLWVYSDITKRQRVGDAQVPLLGIIPVHKEPAGARTHYCVNPVQFLGLSRTYIDTITIMLANERGERIPFAKTGGDDTNVVCCIRFRRCKPAMPI